MDESKKDIVDFMFEIGMLGKTPRSYFNLLGRGNQSVAEHNNRVVFIGYILSALSEGIDKNRLLKMCLFHDLIEARISDLNYLHQKYVKIDEGKVIKEITENLPFGKEIKELILEFEKCETQEAMLANDADQLEFLLRTKEEIDSGNPKTKDWMSITVKRLKTELAKKFAEMILETPSDNWWFRKSIKDEWWINKNKSHT